MRALLFATAALIVAPAAGQDHSGHAAHPPAAAADHSGDGDPAGAEAPDPSPDAHASHGEHRAGTAMDGAPAAEPDHDAMGHRNPEAMDDGAASRAEHESMDHGSMEHGTMHHGTPDHGVMNQGTPADAAHASDPPERAYQGPRHAADAIYGSAAMAPSRAENAAMDQMSFGTIMLERLEARIGRGEDHYLWDAQAWYGGDHDKLWLKSEGEGAFGGDFESAEVQALWSRAIGPFFDVQAGVRYDLEPDGRAHAVLGVQGLAPYMFEVDAAAFLSDKGDLTARIEAEYDQRITQRLILQPHAELSLSAQDIAERGQGSGLTSIESGLRLRYEFAREFAPYVGVGYEAKLGETADYARAAGEDPDGFSLLLGLRAWF